MSGFMELFVGGKVRNISIDSLFHSEPILCGQLRRRTLARFKVDPKNDERHVEKHGDNSSESIKTHITYNLQKENQSLQAMRTHSRETDLKSDESNVTYQVFGNLLLRVVDEKSAETQNEYKTLDTLYNVNQPTRFQNDEIQIATSSQKHYNKKDAYQTGIRNHSDGGIVYDILKEKNNNIFTFNQMPLPKPVPFICKDCGKSYNTKNELENHRTIHYEVTTDSPSKRLAAEENLDLYLGASGRKQKCPKCSKRYSYKWCLTAHLKRDHSVSKHKCPICDIDISFNYRSSLKIHVRNIHNSDWSPIMFGKF